MRSARPRPGAAIVARAGLVAVVLVVAVLVVGGASACGARLTEDQRRAGLRADTQAPDPSTAADPPPTSSTSATSATPPEVQR